MSVTLASNERSVKRELFEQLMKEKERKKAEEKALLEAERLRQEDEEINKVRAQQHFKANPIKKYKNTLGEVARKKLTVLVSPELVTQERAAFKDQSYANADLGEQ